MSKANDFYNENRKDINKIAVKIIEDYGLQDSILYQLGIDDYATAAFYTEDDGDIITCELEYCNARLVSYQYQDIQFMDICSVLEDATDSSFVDWLG